MEQTAQEQEHSRWVRDMFASIATKYDFINRVIAVNFDQSWRRLVVKKLAPELARPDALVLDIACGTGDLSIELQKNAAAKIIGTDFCRPMLSVAQEKTGKKNLQIPFIEGDGMALPFASSTFNAATAAFGLRNFANWQEGLNEMHRVLKPDGRVAILEFASPTLPGFRQIYDLYFDRVLPRVGGILSGNLAGYEHLNKSVRKFPDQKGFSRMLSNTGFKNVEYKNLMTGICAIYTGTKTDEQA
jgi:demethylmenaquinone methyltransferase/2-methoxy-6-polyprenyl-1,4-benzoquinol methylase